MIGRVLVLAVPCAVLASLPVRAETWGVRVTFHNNSSRVVVANWHNNDAGANIINGEIQPGASPDWQVNWESTAVDKSERYDLSFTAAGGSKCSATLVVTSWSSPLGGVVGSGVECAIEGRQNNGLSCDSASAVDRYDKKTCSATIRVD